MRTALFFAGMAVSIQMALAQQPAPLLGQIPQASPPRSHRPHGNCNSLGLRRFTSMVVFGDSYTDDNRLGYFLLHNGSAPPVGWVDPVNYHASSGGRIWAEYVKQYSGANLYNYAVSGAVCSNDITPRLISGQDFDFPDIAGYEVPAYIADSKYKEPNGTRFLNIPADETVYAIWIGTNDLGGDCLISDSQVRGTNITTFVDCIYTQLQRVYANGGRKFVLMNIAPLNLAPLYALPQDGGVVGSSNYWPQKPANTTEISYRMMEQVVTVNMIYDYRTPTVVKLSDSFPGSSWAVYNVHGLMTDIYYNPAKYLNGSAPLNVTAPINQCDSSGSCTLQPSPDSYMWYDNLHPSEQTDRVIARNFVEVVKGGSKWATYWQS